MRSLMDNNNLTRQVAFLSKYYEARNTAFFKYLAGKIISSNFAFWDIFECEPEFGILNENYLQQQLDNSEIITVIDSINNSTRVVMRMWKTKNGQSILLTENWHNIKMLNNKITFYEAIIKNVIYFN